MYSFKNGKKIILRKNIITGQVIWANQALKIDYDRDCLIFYHEYSAKSLSRCDLETGQIRWFFTLPNNDYKSGFLMFFEDYLFVPTHAGYLYVLDRHTGALLWHLDHAFNYYCLDAQNRRLVGVGGHFIHLIDIRTGQRTIKLLDEKTMQEHNFELLQHLGCYQDGLYYFTANMSGEIRIGVLDIATGGLLTITTLNQDNDSSYTARAPDVHADQLYVRDNRGTLYVFEINREE